MSRRVVACTSVLRTHKTQQVGYLGGARQANKASQARSDGKKSCESGVAGYQALC